MSSNIPVQQQGDVAKGPSVDSGAARIINTPRGGYNPTCLNMYQLRELEEAKVCRTADATLHNILGSVTVVSPQLYISPLNSIY